MEKQKRKKERTKSRYCVNPLLNVFQLLIFQPTLQKSFNLHDTCGVHNLHGMPGILSALVAIVLARYSTMNTYTTKECVSRCVLTLLWFVIKTIVMTSITFTVEFLMM